MELWYYGLHCWEHSWRSESNEMIRKIGTTVNWMRDQTAINAYSFYAHTFIYICNTLTGTYIVHEPDPVVDSAWDNNSGTYLTTHFLLGSSLFICYYFIIRMSTSS